MQTRAADGGGKVLEGHFAVFNQPYRVCGRWEETIAPGAFAKWLAEKRDTKVLWNHNSDIVLGSTANGTASFLEDAVGLWGTVTINEDDQDALNAYARVARGDVRGCSFGFDIVRQEEWWDDDGVYHTRVLEADFWEGSPCTFPAYTQTDISARSVGDADAEEIYHNKWQARMLARLKGVR